MLNLELENVESTFTKLSHHLLRCRHGGARPAAGSGGGAGGREEERVIQEL